MAEFQHLQITLLCFSVNLTIFWHVIILKTGVVHGTPLHHSPCAIIFCLWCEQKHMLSHTHLSSTRQNNDYLHSCRWHTIKTCIRRDSGGIIVQAVSMFYQWTLPLKSTWSNTKKGSCVPVPKHCNTLTYLCFIAFRAKIGQVTPWKHMIRSAFGVRERWRCNWNPDVTKS